MEILYPVLTIGSLGLIFGVLLAFVSKKFSVEVDERLVQLQNALPGANCGACGYPGCDNLANAIAQGQAPIDACPVGGIECVKEIAEIMGTEDASKIKLQLAYVRCNGSEGNTKDIYDYDGTSQCAAVTVFAGGQKACPYACLGFGDCVKACLFDAIEIRNQKAVVDPDKCTGCGQCTRACPKNIISMFEAKSSVFVSCRNQNPGKAVRAVCTRGCIGCKSCERICKFDAIKVIDGIAVIDYYKCIGCGACVNKCPTDCIIMYKGRS